MNRGQAVFVTNPPMYVAIGTAIIVETKPLIAAPIPAMCPSGCIANERKFPKRNPIEKNCNPKKDNNIYTLGFG